MPPRSCSRALQPPLPHWRSGGSVRKLPDHQTRAGRRAAVRRLRVRGLHAYFLDRLVPACASLLDASVEVGDIRSDIDALSLMHAAGNLRIGVEGGGDTSYDAHRMVGLLIAGLRQSPSA